MTIMCIIWGMTESLKIDWKATIESILTTQRAENLPPWSYRTIGKAVGMSSSAIGRLRNEPMADPPHSKGQALLRLHQTITRPEGGT